MSPLLIILLALAWAACAIVSWEIHQSAFRRYVGIEMWSPEFDLGLSIAGCALTGIFCLFGPLSIVTALIQCALFPPSKD